MFNSYTWKRMTVIFIYEHYKNNKIREQFYISCEKTHIKFEKLLNWSSKIKKKKKKIFFHGNY